MRPQRKIFPRIIQILKIGDKVFKRSMLYLRKETKIWRKQLKKQIFSIELHNKKLNRHTETEKSNICNKQSSDSFHKKLVLTLKIKQ